MRGTAVRIALVSASLVTLLAAGAAYGSGAYFGKPSRCTNGSHSLRGKTIGLSFEESLSLFSQLQTDIKKFAALGGCGLKFKITNANGDPARQLTDVQSLIAQKVDLVFVNPAEPQGWEPIAASAKDAGIPYMNWSSVVVGAATVNATVWQSEAGAVVAVPAAKWINKQPGGKADVAMLVSLTDPGFQARAAAFKKTLLQLAPGAHFVATAPGGFNSSSVAEKATLNLIQAHPSLKMIFADWDGATLGAVQAAKESGKTDPSKFYIVGQDGSPEQLKLMQKPGSVLQSSGTLLFRLDAGVIERDMERLLLGLPVLPTRLLVPEPVTPANVNQVVALQDRPYTLPRSEFCKITAYFNIHLKSGDPLPKPTLKTNCGLG
jgi:ABC-type sugar transport system substrate-binding protein